MQRHFMTALLSYRQPLALVRSKCFHRWSTASIEWVAVEFIAIAAYESGCVETSLCNPKCDLAPRVPTFDQGMRFSDVFTWEYERDHRLDLPVIHQPRYLGQGWSDRQRRGDQLLADTVRLGEELGVGTS
jgi:hypothetical protein